MRIALFTDTYLPTLNGVAITLARLVAEAARRGHEVALVTPRLPGDPPPGPALHLRLPGVSLPIYPELRVARPMSRREGDALAAFDPQVVHLATEATVGWSGRRWALRRHLPILTSFHTNFPTYAREYGLGWLEGSVWRSLRRFHAVASRSFCPTETTRTVLLERGFHPNWHLWPRGVDPDRFSPAYRRVDVREALAPGAGPLIVSVGRLAPEKRCDLALSAFERVRGRFPDAALVFVGDGPARKRLEARRVPGVDFAGARANSSFRGRPDSAARPERPKTSLGNSGASSRSRSFAHGCRSAPGRWPWSGAGRRPSILSSRGTPLPWRGVEVCPERGARPWTPWLRRRGFRSRRSSDDARWPSRTESRPSRIRAPPWVPYWEWLSDFVGCRSYFRRWNLGPTPRVQSVGTRTSKDKRPDDGLPVREGFSPIRAPLTT